MARMSRARPQKSVSEGQISLNEGSVGRKGRPHDRAGRLFGKQSLLTKSIQRVCGPDRRKRGPIRGQVTMEMVNIVNVRNEKGYTQEKMARLAHVDRSTLASYETGRRPVPRDVLDAIEKAKERWPVKYGDHGKPSES